MQNKVKKYMGRRRGKFSLIDDLGDIIELISDIILDVISDAIN